MGGVVDKRLGTLPPARRGSSVVDKRIAALPPADPQTPAGPSPYASAPMGPIGTAIAGAIRGFAPTSGYLADEAARALVRGGIGLPESAAGAVQATGGTIETLGRMGSMLPAVAADRARMAVLQPGQTLRNALLGPEIAPAPMDSTSQQMLGMAATMEPTDPMLSQNPMVRVGGALRQVTEPAMEFYGAQKADPAIAPSPMAQARPFSPSGLTSSIGENLPQLALQLAAAYTTGGGSAAGRIAGFATSAFPMELGGAQAAGREGFIQQGDSPDEASLKASPSAALQAAVNTIIESISGAGIFAPAAKAAMKAGLFREALKIAGQGARAGFTGGVTAAAQEGVNIAGELASGSNPNAGQGAGARMLQAGIVGGLLEAPAGAFEAGREAVTAREGVRPTAQPPNSPPPSASTDEAADSLDERFKMKPSVLNPLAPPPAAPAPAPDFADRIISEYLARNSPESSAAPVGAPSADQAAQPEQVPADPTSSVLRDLGIDPAEFAQRVERARVEQFRANPQQAYLDGQITREQLVAFLEDRVAADPGEQLRREAEARATGPTRADRPMRRVDRPARQTPPTVTVNPETASGFNPSTVSNGSPRFVDRLGPFPRVPTAEPGSSQAAAPDSRTGATAPPASASASAPPAAAAPASAREPAASSRTSPAPAASVGEGSVQPVRGSSRSPQSTREPWQMTRGEVLEAMDQFIENLRNKTAQVHEWPALQKRLDELDKQQSKAARQKARADAGSNNARPALWAISEEEATQRLTHYDKMTIKRNKSTLRSIAYRQSKKDGTRIFVFGTWGKEQFSGNGETLRKTADEAFADARQMVREARRISVVYSLELGKPVPPEVLAEYGLATSAAPQNQARSEGATGESVTLPDRGGRVIEPPVGQQPGAASQTRFTTAKGSTYILHEDGTTTRNKAVRHDHPGSGPQPRSDKTWFIRPEDWATLESFGGTKAYIDQHPDGRIGVRATQGANTGKFYQGSMVTPQKTPEVGFTPIEWWKGEPWHTIHVGNFIVSVESTPPNPPAKPDSSNSQGTLTSSPQPQGQAAAQPQTQEPKNGEEEGQGRSQGLLKTGTAAPVPETGAGAVGAKPKPKPGDTAKAERQAEVDAIAPDTELDTTGAPTSIADIANNVREGKRRYVTARDSQNKRLGASMLASVRSSIESGMARLREERAKWEARATNTAKAKATADDIPMDVAERAFSGTSHVPEKRARTWQSYYVNDFNNLAERFRKLADTDELRAALEEELTRFQEGLKSKYLAYLGAHSRVMSSMITGPARFPVEANRKRMESADKRLAEIVEFVKRADKSITKRLFPQASGVIRSDDENAPDALRAAIDARQRRQEAMKEANKIIRKGGDKAAMITSLEGLGFSNDEANRVIYPKFQRGMGFPGYSLTNNNKEIRRLQERLAQIEAQRSREPRTATFPGGKVVENADAQRVQITFPGKPDEATREKLKGRGFKWAPSEGAWQRLMNEAAWRAALQVTGATEDAKAPAQTENTDEIDAAEVAEEVERRKQADAATIPQENADGTGTGSTGGVGAARDNGQGAGTGNAGGDPRTPQRAPSNMADRAIGALERIAEEANARMKSRAKARGYRLYSTPIPDPRDMLDAAAWVAAHAALAGVRTGRALTGFITSKLAEKFPGHKWDIPSVRRVVKRYLAGGASPNDVLDRWAESKESLTKKGVRTVADGAPDPKAVKDAAAEAAAARPDVSARIIKAVKARYRQGRAEGMRTASDALKPLIRQARDAAKRARQVAAIETRGAVDAAKNAAADQAATEKGIRTQAVRLVQETPIAGRGKYLRAVAKAKTMGDLARILHRLRGDLAKETGRHFAARAERLAGNMRKLDSTRRENARKLLDDIRKMYDHLRDKDTGTARREDLAAQIRDSFETLNSIFHEQRNADKVYMQGRAIVLAEHREQMMESLQKQAELPPPENGKEDREPGWLRQKLRKYGDFRTLMQILDRKWDESGIFAKARRAMSERRTAELAKNQEFIDRAEQIVKANGYESWSDFMERTEGAMGDSGTEWVNIDLGPVKRITVGQAMALYAQDAETKELMHAGQPWRLNRNGESFVVDDYKLAELESKLTPGQKRIARQINQLRSDMQFERADGVYKRITGNHMVKVDGHYPRKRILDKSGSEDTVDIAKMSMGEWAVQSLENSGFTIKRVQDKKTPLLLEDFGSTQVRSFQGAEMMIQRAEMVKYLKATLFNPAISDAIAQRYGGSMMRRLTQVVAEYSGNSAPESDKFIRAIAAGSARSMTQVNPGTWARNLSTVYRLPLAMLDGKMLGLAAVAAAIPKALANWRSTLKTLMEHSPDLRHRWSHAGAAISMMPSGATTDVDSHFADASKATLRQLAYALKAFRNPRAAASRLGQVRKSWNQVLDSIKVGNAFDAFAAVVAYHALRSQAPESLSPRAGDKWAAKKAADAFMQTANTNDLLNANEWQTDAKRNTATALILTFTSDIAKMQNLLFLAIKRGGKARALALGAVTASVAWSVAIRYVLGALLGDDEDKREADAASTAVQELVSLVPAGARLSPLVEYAINPRGGQPPDILDTPLSSFGANLRGLYSALDREEPQAGEAAYRAFRLLDVLGNPLGPAAGMARRAIKNYGDE